MIEPASSERDLFEQALTLDPASRAAYLQAHCRDLAQRRSVERMLAADSKTEAQILARPLDEILGRVGEIEVDSPSPGACIGPFTVLEKLGEGGSSIVFRAEREQAGVRQTVALKLLRRGLYTIDEQRHFRDERRALAQLQHPGIARLIEGGVSDTGIPYIALELIEGKNIVEHARARQLGLRQRLGLFIDVCRAVESAHRALIVHRDLKPSNVLVTSAGEIKLLDFGIAKLLDAEAEQDGTPTQYAPMTPAYAAPEQFAHGPITTATDVYALGVVLCELISGQRREAGDSRTPSSQVNDEIADEARLMPAKLLRRKLRGDLDNIVLRATAVEPERRYASAGAFADDIACYLAGQPVAAHPPSRLYRARKFIGRHRGGVVTTALFLLAILASLGVAIWQANIARTEAQRAGAMRDFMVSAFVQAEPSVPREGPPRITEVVENAIAQASGDAHMNPAVRSELLSELGAVLRQQGRLEKANSTLSSNYENSLRAFGSTSELTLMAGHEYAQVLILTGEYDAARKLIDSLIANTSERAAAFLSKLLFDSAYLATKRHEISLAVADGSRAIALARGLGESRALADALSNFGNVQLIAGDLDGARSSYEELLNLQVRRYGATHLTVASAHANLSRTYRRAGRLDESESQIRAALAIDAAVLPKDDWRRAMHLNALTMVLLQRRDYSAARDAAAESLRIDRIAHGDDHPDTANDLNSLGMLEGLLGHHTAAVNVLHEALQRVEAKFGPNHYETAIERANYGAALARSGQIGPGRAELLRAYASLDALQDVDPEDQALTCEKLARLELESDNASAALSWIDRIDTRVAAISKPASYWNGRAASLRAAAAIRMGKPADATRLLDSAAAEVNRLSDADHVLRVEIPLLQAWAAAALGDSSSAMQFSVEGRARLSKLSYPPDTLQSLAARVDASGALAASEPPHALH